MVRRKDAKTQGRNDARLTRGRDAGGQSGPCVFASLRPCVQAAVAILTLTAAPAAAQFDAGIPVGSKAPAVTINDLDGKPVDLGTMLGRKPVLLEFWATWCPICKSLLPALGRVRQTFGDRVELIGVNVTVNDSKDRIRRYLAEHRPPFRVLFDDKGVGARAFDVPGTSFVVVVDGGGKVVYTGSGEDQDLVAAVRRALPNP
jgi:thiol-disulfide isomerase/thioredoxin